MPRDGSVQYRKRVADNRANYPKYDKVKKLLEQLRVQRQPVLDRILEEKRARRNDWNHFRAKLPQAYQKLPIIIGEAEIPEMIIRIAGLVTKGEPMIQVMPPSGNRADVSKASKEESLLRALFQTIGDQQQRDTWSMGVDGQCAWGESWISMWHEGNYYSEGALRKADEKGADYIKRVNNHMAQEGVPIRLEDHDPMTVFPLWDKRDRLQVLILETEHPYFEIEDVFGYSGVKDSGGNTVDWQRKAIGAPRVPEDSAVGETGPADVNHDRGTWHGGGDQNDGQKVKKVVYLDNEVCCVYINGHVVEEWEHKMKRVPCAYAAGKQTSDRDPKFATAGIADSAIDIAKKIVFFESLMASNAFLHGLPTPFVTNPLASEVGPDGSPMGTRQIKIAEMNLLGQGEEISFPLNEAKLSSDFWQTIDILNGKLSEASLGGFNKALNSDIAGYAIAQVRSMQMSVLSTLYKNARRQWRDLAYMARHVIKEDLSAGVVLRGAIETTEDGVQYRAIHEFGSQHCTDFAIDVEIPEGIMQDEMAERKSAMEMVQAGLWSKRRAMEMTGVEDPAAEDDEIAIDRMLSSDMASQAILDLAYTLVGMRTQSVLQAQNTPFHQMLEQAKQGLLTSAGQPQNQPGQPQNALPGGEPVQQNPAPTVQQPGGPQDGPPAGGVGGQMGAAGVPQIPGGVKGAPQVPVGAPG